jgi:uncharacterized protein Yka (UPF0111/DUF47 family)
VSERQARSRLARWSRLLRSFGPRAGRDLVTVLACHLDVDADAVGLVRSMLEGRSPHAEATARMQAVEHRGDELRAELVAALDRALVTPMDREDLYRLSRAIDDVLDGLRDFVREWDLFHVRNADALLRVLDAIATAIADIRVAVETIARSPDATSPEMRTAQRSANRIRLVHEDEIAVLFAGELSMHVLRQRELLHRLDAVGLHLVEAVHVLADGFVKRGE